MSKAMTIRNVPDDVVRALASRAASRGQSMQEFLRAHVIDLVARPDIEVWVEGVQHHKRSTARALPEGSIIAARDADRR